MGNADLIIIVNTYAYLIGGSEYETRAGAIQMALTKFYKYQQEIDRSRYDEKGELFEMADEHWVPEDIMIIRVYESPDLLPHNKEGEGV